MWCDLMPFEVLGHDVVQNVVWLYGHSVALVAVGGVVVAVDDDDNCY